MTQPPAQLPSQGQLLLPLLKVLDEHGPMRAKDACAAVADELQIAPEVRDVRGPRCADGQEPLLFDRRVRWTRQTAVGGDLIDSTNRGVWALTDRGRGTHRFAKPGVVVTVWEADGGTIFWSEFRSAVQYITPGSATACITSPPYPLIKQRSYAQDMRAWAPERYVQTLLDEVALIKPLLAHDGSLVLNLGPTFLRESAARNPYMHQILAKLVDSMGWSIIDEHFWHNPTKPRAGAQVTQWRTHCVQQMEMFYILSPTGATKCSNWRVLNPYTPRQKKLIASGGEVVTAASPSRMQTPGRRHSKDNGGAIPSNFHQMPHDRDAEYRRRCAEIGVEPHAAMMPMKLCEFFIELTTEPGDLVLEPYGGSLKMVEAALRKDRRVIATERCLNQIAGGLTRLGPAGSRWAIAG